MPRISQGDLPNVNPIEAAQVPETAMARAVVRVRPQRSPRTPPSRQPTAPAPMTTKVPTTAAVRVGPAGAVAAQAVPSGRRPSSWRTSRVPSTRLRSFRKATSRTSWYRPQSVLTTSRSAGM
jgi:hypothetical protein